MSSLVSQSFHSTAQFGKILTLVNSHQLPVLPAVLGGNILLELGIFFASHAPRYRNCFFLILKIFQYQVFKGGMLNIALSSFHLSYRFSTILTSLKLKPQHCFLLEDGLLSVVWFSLIQSNDNTSECRATIDLRPFGIDTRALLLRQQWLLKKFGEVSFPTTNILWDEATHQQYSSC